MTYDVHAHNVRRLYFDSFLHLSQAIGFLLDLVGPSQVMVGTDYPYPMAERHPVSFIDSIPGLRHEDREGILTDNVDRILKGIRR